LAAEHANPRILLNWRPLFIRDFSKTLPEADFASCLQQVMTAKGCFTNKDSCHEGVE